VGPYAEGWRKYRKVRRDFWLVWIGGFLVVGVTAAASERLFDSVVAVQIAAGVWMLMFAIVGIRFQTFRCPRCGRWFAAKWWYNKSFLARKCVHCGLPKLSDDGN
jgi:hypothetical protein